MKNPKIRSNQYDTSGFRNRIYYKFITQNSQTLWQYFTKLHLYLGITNALYIPTILNSSQIMQIVQDLKFPVQRGKMID